MAFVRSVCTSLYSPSRVVPLLSLVGLFAASTTVYAFAPSTTLSSNDSTRTDGVCKSTNGNDNDDMVYPELLVLDLDACSWDQEMYEMPAIPSASDVVQGDLNGRGQGVIGVMSGPHQISLHKGTLIGLQEHADGKYGSMKIAFASSADTPFAEKIGRASLKLLEVLPGLTVWDLVVGRDWNGKDVNQIGRQPPLSSNKAASHFPRLKQVTGIRYDRMLFFDDCNWGDHCGMVAAGCREPDTGVGPAMLRTPYGIQEHDWRKGLDVYAKHAKALSSSGSKV